jgi:hypothetical protein
MQAVAVAKERTQVLVELAAAARGLLIYLAPQRTEPQIQVAVEAVAATSTTVATAAPASSS